MSYMTVNDREDKGNVLGHNDLAILKSWHVLDIPGEMSSRKMDI